MTTPRRHGSAVGLPVVGAIVMVVCCAGPTIIAGALFSTVGGLVGGPIFAVVGTCVMVLAVGVTLRRRGNGRAGCTEAEAIRTDVNGR